MKRKIYQVWFTRDGMSYLIARFKSEIEAETFIGIEGTQMELDGGTFEIIKES